MKMEYDLKQSSRLIIYCVDCFRLLVYMVTVQQRSMRMTTREKKGWL